MFDRRDYLPRANWSGFFRHLVGEIRAGGLADARLAGAYWYVVGAVDFRPAIPSPALNPQTGALEHRPEKLAAWRARNLDGVRQLAEFDRAQKRPAGLSDAPEGTPGILRELRSRRAKMEGRFRGFGVVQNAIARDHQVVFRRSGGIRYDLFADPSRAFGEEKTTDVNLAVDMVMLKDQYDIAVVVSGDQDFVPAVAAVQELGRKVVNVSFKRRSGGLLPNGAWRLNRAADQSVKVEYEDFRRFLFPDS